MIAYLYLLIFLPNQKPIAKHLPQKSMTECVLMLESTKLTSLSGMTNVSYLSSCYESNKKKSKKGKKSKKKFVLAEGKA